VRGNSLSFSLRVRFQGFLSRAKRLCLIARPFSAKPMKGLDNVTLLGEPTDGRLFLGNSVALDRTVERIPTDWTGQTDSQLAAAVKLLAAGK